MKVARSLLELRQMRPELNQDLGFVPTMGALHKGHQSLMAMAREECRAVLVSIFVNPTQFGPGEDLEAYPRPLEADLEKCRQMGVDLVWVPQVEDLYPKGAQTAVVVEPLGQKWEGESRPHHFRGVATVVTKLLLATRPQRAYFGEKDLQQLQLIRRLVQDLLFEVEVCGVPIARAENGLALSSRNSYLSPEQREQAGQIFQGLQAALAAYKEGATADTIEATFRGHLEQTLSEAEVERLDLITSDFGRNFRGEELVENGFLSVAVRYAGVRLIDQVELCS